MREDTVVQLRQPGANSEDALTEILRLGARRLLAQAVEMEVTIFVEGHADLTDEAGRRRIVRHGYLPEREIQTGIGPVSVRCPRVRDRGAGETGPRIRFTSAILPRYLRRAKSIEELLPWLYLKGISTGDFSEALAALLGPEAPGLSASTIVRLKEVWQGEMERWQRRDLSAKRYVYFWADGVYFSPRLDHDKQCMCVIIGADEMGRKELLAIADGYRESAQSWREVLLDLKRRVEADFDWGSSMSGSVAAFAAVTISFGEPGANAMAFCSWQPLSRQRPSRRLSCRPPLWLGGGPVGPPHVPPSPAALFPFLSGPACPFSGSRRTVPRPSIFLTSTFR